MANERAAPSLLVTGEQEQTMHAFPTSHTSHGWPVPFGARQCLKRLSTTKLLAYIRGPVRPDAPTHVRPWLGPLERDLQRYVAGPLASRYWLLVLFLALWIVAFALLVRTAYYQSSTSDGGSSVQWISTTSTYWSRNDECGLDGSSCEPFSTDSVFAFRCPAHALSTELLNQRAVGAQEVIYQPLVVGGGGDGELGGTYRADSWICASAIHAGLFSNARGGCGALQLTGAGEVYEASTSNGVSSVAFPSQFPKSFVFVSRGDKCADLRNEIIGFSVVMTTLFSLLFRPTALMFFWVLFAQGYWIVCLVTYQNDNPPDIEAAFASFLPALFVGYAFWRSAWRWVVPAFEAARIEQTVWYLAGFWLGTLMNISLSWIPVDRLTPHDIQQRPGGLVAVIVLSLVVLLVIVNQLRVIRRAGVLPLYARWYALGAIVVGLLFTLPALEFRLHHYIVAIVLTPGTAFVTRPSAFFQAFLLGMFLNGVARWGFDSLLQTAESLRGDAALGTELPAFTNITDATVVSWEAIPSELTGSWDGFALLVDDVLRYTGSATNFTLASIDGLDLVALPHFLRLAYRSGADSGDFTKAATVLTNGTWIKPEPGPS